MNFVCLVFELGDKTLTWSPMENLMVKCNHVYSPREGADNPLGPKYFHKHKSSDHLLISSKFSAIFLFSPIQMHGRPKLTLP